MIFWEIVHFGKFRGTSVDFNRKVSNVKDIKLKYENAMAMIEQEEKQK